MKIALVAPLCISVPPKQYGGTERVVHQLAEALVKLGHEVDLYASGDSQTSANLIPCSDIALWSSDTKPSELFWHTMMMEKVVRRAIKYDIIHFHLDVYPLSIYHSLPCPAILTQHGRMDIPDYDILLSQFPAAKLVSISQSQRNQLPGATWVGTVHHGIDKDLYSLVEEPENYFVFIGRVSHEKGTDDAIRIAIATNTPIKIAAKIEDQAFFEANCELFEHPLVEMVGLVTDEQKQELIGKAKALLFPIKWPEPFGMVMIEALACGTPVIAYDRGSVPEVLSHQLTGFIVKSEEQAIHAALRIDELDRRKIRQEFESRFTAERMATDYEAVYDRLVTKPKDCYNYPIY